MKFKKGDYILSRETNEKCTNWQLALILDTYFNRNPNTGDYEVEVLHDTGNIYDKRDNWLISLVDDCSVKVEEECLPLYRALFE